MVEDDAKPELVPGLAFTTHTTHQNLVFLSNNMGEGVFVLLQSTILKFHQGQCKLGGEIRLTAYIILSVAFDLG